MEAILDQLNKKLIIENKHAECKKEYSRLKSDEERVKFTIRLLLQYKMSPAVMVEPKSTAKATEYKNKGNKLYANTKYLDLDAIIENYTKSVAYAPAESQELSMAYANRSAALFKARLYDDCLRDIERALQLDYPAKLKAKLFARKARCLMILKANASQSDEALEDARHWLQQMELQENGRKIVEKTLNDPLQMAAIEGPRELLKDERNLPTITKDNLNIPGATSAIEIRYSKQFGRHVVATRDIEPGEYLAVQLPYAAILVPVKFYTHCDNCLKQTWSAIPCDYCVHVIYCSDECRKFAWNDHHDVECQVIGPLLALEMSNLGLLSMRLAVRAAKEAENLKALKEKITMIDCAGCDGNMLDDKDYESVYTLTRNTDERSVPDLFGRSLNSTYILYMLAKLSDLFEDRVEGLDDLEKNELMTFVGGLIMRHQQIIPSNVHSMTEEGQGVDPIERGAALMPFYSLFNHSCSPVVTRQSYGRNIAMLSIMPIKRGDQIFDNYGMHYALHPKIYRLQKLKQQYHFDCVCIACKNDWPLYTELLSYQERKLPGAVRNKIMNALRNFEMYYELAAVGNIETRPEMIEELVKMISILCRHVDLPCEELNNVVETLKRVHALCGSRWQSLND